MINLGFVLGCGGASGGGLKEIGHPASSLMPKKPCGCQQRRLGPRHDLSEIEDLAPQSVTQDQRELSPLGPVPWPCFHGLSGPQSASCPAKFLEKRGHWGRIWRTARSRCGSAV